QAPSGPPLLRWSGRRLELYRETDIGAPEVELVQRKIFVLADFESNGAGVTHVPAHAPVIAEEPDYAAAHIEREVGLGCARRIRHDGGRYRRDVESQAAHAPGDVHLDRTNRRADKHVARNSEHMVFRNV